MASMAKLTTPTLVSVATDASALRSLRDHRTEVATDPATAATPRRVRLTIANSDGTLSAALVAGVHPTGGWDGSLSCLVAAGADGSTVARVNRLVRGFQPTFVVPSSLSPTGSLPTPPRVETDWRTHHVVVRPGRGKAAVNAPATFTASPGTPGRWFVANQPGGTLVAPNITAGFAPLAVSPTHTPSATPATPSATPVAPLSAPPTPSPTGRSEGTNPPTITTPTVKPQPLPSGHPGIFTMIPQGGMKVHVEPRVAKSLEVAWAGYRRGRRTVIVLRGPSGSGKTISAQDLAARHGLPFLHVDVMALRDFSDWTGSVTLKAGPDGNVVTEFTPAMFAEAISADGPYGGIPRIVLLDEITRAETSGAQNALLPVLGGHASIYVPDARRVIPIDPAVLFVATANIGASFTGTVTMDEALINRGTSWVPVDYPNPDVEATILVEQAGVDPSVATTLVAVGRKVREIADRGEIERSVSTRQLVVAANHVRDGHTLVDACRDAFVETFSAEGGAASDHHRVMLAVNSVAR